MKYANTPPVDVLRELLEYDPVTGALSWRERTAASIPHAFVRAAFNARHAGHPALYHKSVEGYLSGTVEGGHRFAHRVAWAIYHGAWPENEIDHINGDRTDNRIVNLRDVPSQANQRNRALRKGREGEVIGVSWHRGRGMWQARISDGKKKRWLGAFVRKADAIAARKRAERDLGYHANHGRGR